MDVKVENSAHYAEVNIRATEVRTSSTEVILDGSAGVRCTGSVVLSKSARMAVVK